MYQVQVEAMLTESGWAPISQWDTPLEFDTQLAALLVCKAVSAQFSRRTRCTAGEVVRGYVEVDGKVTNAA